MNNFLSVKYLFSYYRYQSYLLVTSLLLLWLCIPNKTWATLGTVQGSPLHQAVMQGDVDTVRNLLQEGVKVDDIDKQNRTPLVLAAARGYTTIMELLLKAGARVNGRKRHTPLQEAALYGQLESMRMLINHKAKIPDCCKTRKNMVFCVLNEAKSTFCNSLDPSIYSCRIHIIRYSDNERPSKSYRTSTLSQRKAEAK